MLRIIRTYAGHAKELIQYFPLKMPVAVGPEVAAFVYVGPGMGTRSELDTWVEATAAVLEEVVARVERGRPLGQRQSGANGSP